MIFRPSYVLLPVAHVQQHVDGDCLAACTAMVLNYYAIPYHYDRLVRLLQIQRPYGTAFSNIRELTKQRIIVTCQQGNLQELHAQLVKGNPCIVAVQTGELPYWNGVSLYHAVVVVGMQGDSVLLNDPAFPTAPTRVSIGDFDLAWLEQDELYAVLALPAV